MNYKIGDIVEVSITMTAPDLAKLAGFTTCLNLLSARKVEGDKDDPGFRDSWSQYKVTRVAKRRSVTVQSLEVRAVVGVAVGATTILLEILEGFFGSFWRAIRTTAVR